MNKKTSKISKPNGTKPFVKRSAKPRYWICIIGETEWNDLPNGADLPIRQATKKAFKKLTGHDDNNCWSGWSADKKTVDKVLKAWS